MQKDISYDSFHKYVMHGQKMNKENPGKFGTVEMYSFLINGIELEIYENIELQRDDILKMLRKLHHDMIASL